MNNKCVHTEHCCAKHGCKYMDDDCPVADGTKTAHLINSPQASNK